jgi:CDP-glycerol glycerophosphotransferase (TagB/SpsB family)
VAIRLGKRAHPISVIVDRYVRGVIAAEAVRVVLPLLSRAAHRRIVLFGHEPNGNLYALDKAMRAQVEQSGDAMEWRTMVDDPKLYRRLRRAGRTDVLSAQRIGHILWAARAHAIVSSHGPVFLRSWLTSRRRPVFVDVWHGVGFKASIAEADSALLAYDAHFVSSPFVAEEYTRAGAQPVVTGYARTDVTIAAGSNASARAAVMAHFAPDHAAAPLVLFAPTWAGTGDDEKSGELGSSEDVLRLLNGVAEENGFVVGYRGHINSAGSAITDLNRVRALGQDVAPISEELLGSVDVLITDWSSIATDYLALDRPIVYLDRPAPRAHLAPLDAKDRVGAIVASPQQLALAISEAVTNSTAYREPFSADRAKTVEKAWGASLDGRSGERTLLAITEQIERR